MTEIEFKIKKHLYDCYPHPVPSKKMVPSWYKKMGLYMDETIESPLINGHGNLTMKSCVPIRDALTSGYTLLLPSDMSVTLIDKKLQFEWLNGNDQHIEGHTIEQVKGTPLEKMTSGEIIMKLVNPWRIYTKPGYSCHFLQPAYHELPFEILPGIVDTDKRHEVNFPFIWKSKEEHVVLKKGLPMVQIYPFKRVSWKSKVSIQKPEEEIKQYKNFMSHFGHWYRDFAHSKKSYK